MGEKIVWLDFKVRRSLAWQINEEQILDVQLRGFWLTHLTRMERLDTFVDFMVDNHPTSMALKKRKEEVALKSQVMMMRIGLSCYQI
jgi:3-phenylpropionate/cinnamic acid dioxygenase small subunit